MQLVLGAIVRAILPLMLRGFGVFGRAFVQNPTAATMVCGAGRMAGGQLGRVVLLWLAVVLAIAPYGQAHAQVLPVLAVNLSMSPTQARAGDAVAFILTVKNISQLTYSTPNVFYGIPVTIPAAESLYTGSSSNCFGVRESNTRITLHVPDIMGPGDSCTLLVDKRILADADIGTFTAGIEPFGGPAIISFSQAPITILPSLPAISSVTPASGSVGGGQIVTIVGNHFEVGGTSVTFGGVAATDVNVSSSTSLTTVVPRGAMPGATGVVVTTAQAGSSTVPASYTYINSPPAAIDHSYTMSQSSVFWWLDPPGLLQGATDPDGDTLTLDEVILAGVDSSDYRSDGFLIIGREDPAFFGHRIGTYTIADAHGARTTASLLLEVQPSTPRVTRVAVAEGPLAGGSQVTISGTNFRGATDVRFGGIAATSFSVEKGSTITAIVPPGTAAGPVSVSVHKVNEDTGMSVEGSLAAGFTYLRPGALSVMSPDELAATGPYGGPFTPTAASWTVGNNGEEAIDVQIAANGSFFGVTGAEPATSFTLAPGETRTVTATLNTTVLTLVPGPYSGSIAFTNITNGAGNTDRSIVLDVGQASTALSLSTSNATPDFGDEITFTATLSGGLSPAGTVEFFDGATSLGIAPLVNGAARLPVATLSAGTHAITATYSGDGDNAPSTSAPLAQQVRALGSIIIRQETDGVDAVFGFSSLTSALNLSIPTSGGHGESVLLSLPAGRYAITANDMTGIGFGLTGVFCSDEDSATDLASRTANIVLGVGEALICTFTSVNSRKKTTQLIEEFLTTRGSLILANQPDIQRRIDRLNGAAPAGGSTVSSLMGYLPGMVESGVLSGSTSLAAINHLAGDEQPGRFDVWFEGTFALFDTSGPSGTFNTASLGADYLVSPDILVGGFVQMDHLTQSSTVDPATIAGIGWLAGPYVTARIGDNLYLDILAAAGKSYNTVSPYGTYEDGFDATRWLISTSLQGQWQWDAWTLSPRVQASYFEETTRAYTDTLGVAIPSTTAGVGQIAVGPAISYRYTSEGNVVIDTGLRFEGIADILKSSAAFGLDNPRGRIEATLDLTLPGGASLGFSAAYDGVRADMSTTSGKIRVSAPFN